MENIRLWDLVTISVITFHCYRWKYLTFAILRHTTITEWSAHSLFIQICWKQVLWKIFFLQIIYFSVHNIFTRNILLYAAILYMCVCMCNQVSRNSHGFCRLLSLNKYAWFCGVILHCQSNYKLLLILYMFSSFFLFSCMIC